MPKASQNSNQDKQAKLQCPDQKDHTESESQGQQLWFTEYPRWGNQCEGQDSRCKRNQKKWPKDFSGTPGASLLHVAQVNFSVWVLFICKKESKVRRLGPWLGSGKLEKERKGEG